MLQEELGENEFYVILAEKFLRFGELHIVAFRPPSGRDFARVRVDARENLLPQVLHGLHHSNTNKSEGYRWDKVRTLCSMNWRNGTRPWMKAVRTTSFIMISPFRGNASSVFSAARTAFCSFPPKKTHPGDNRKSDLLHTADAKTRQRMDMHVFWKNGGPGGPPS